MLHAQQQHSFSPLDLNMLSLLTGDAIPSSSSSTTSPSAAAGTSSSSKGKSKSNQSDRRPPVDPLMVAAAAAAGPDITRNHYLHEFFPHTLAYASCDDERPPPPAAPPVAMPHPMQSRQAPRRVRLATEAEERRVQEDKVASSQATAIPAPSQPVPIQQRKEDTHLPATTTTTGSASTSAHATARRLSVSDPATIKLLRHPPITSPTSTTAPLPAAAASLPPLIVKCEVRTRIPTPHGHIFLHLYSNNHDTKEHLAFVADQAQMDALHPITDRGTPSAPFLRSTSLDSEWRQGETEMERIVRGAYVGRLSASTIHPSTSPSSPNPSLPPLAAESTTTPEPPLVRIHSECFTGEVIGSQRCDCGEQLDEAFRLITLHQRGVVVYLRQEGRGIGLLEKMRAYNLQDLGHDTVTANLMLGHGADLRTYDVAGAILRDLKVGEVRLLTNNPDKIEQIEREGVRVVERVAMVPRSWMPVERSGNKKRGGKQSRKRRTRMSGAALLQQGLDSMASSMLSVADFPPSATYSDVDDSSLPFSSDEASSSSEDEEDESYTSSSSDSATSHNLRRSGVGMIGASITRSAELEKYLRTKIERMGHMLDAPPPVAAAAASEPVSRAASPGMGGKKHRKPKLSRSASTTGAAAASAVGGKEGKPHPLASEVVSAEGAGAGECGSGCEECRD